MILKSAKKVKTILVYSLLLLFTGYYGSISFFYHSHIILGDTIVHSHPYKSDNNGNPLHSHSEKGYMTIQMLSFFPAYSILIIYAFRNNATVIYELITTTSEGAENNALHYSYSLRAPPSGLIF